MSDKPKTLIRGIAYLAIAAVAVVSIYAIYCSYCWWWSPVGTVLVVRHAEKSSAGSDPPLSPAGTARAQTLAHVLGDAGVNAVYATQFLRTHQTVEPTATAHGLAIIEYSATDAAALADTLRSEHAGGVVLVAGHSNTVTEIIEELGGDPVGVLAETDYDNLFVVAVRRCWGARVLHLKYGDPT
ncbi:MAG: histidine phosphatase family protein [bacterium]|nr:histidine phosphatase family protein [bacterium]